jgi:DNA-binding response OmpR family regulator
MRDILIIQDSPALNRLLKFVLESEGLSVDLTETGAEGLDFANSVQYSLILLDYMLPNTNGGDVCKELRNRDLTKSTPILFISSKDESELAAIVEQVGADGYLMPPFKGDEFISKIKKYI